MMTRVRVASVDDFEEDDRKFVTVDGRTVGVVRYRGEYYAVANRCPHQHGSVCDGLVRARLVADWNEVGERTTETIDHSRPSVTCPKHGWEFDLGSGKHLGDPSIRLDTYDVVVEDHVVYVSDRSDADSE